MMFHVKQIGPGDRFGLTLVMREQRGCNFLRVMDARSRVLPNRGVATRRLTAKRSDQIMSAYARMIID
jgi:hypothetical protein